MKLSVLILGVLVGLSGCPKAEVARKPGLEVMASRMGLKVEWIQMPFANEQYPALYPYGANLRNGKSVEFSLFRLTNVSEKRLDLYFEGFETDQMNLTQETFCALTPAEAAEKLNFGIDYTPSTDVFDVFQWLCQYRSAWRASGLGLVRENGRKNEVEVRDRGNTDPIGEMEDLRQGESVVLVASLTPVDADPIPSKPRPVGMGASFVKSVFVPLISRPENDELAAQLLLSTLTESFILPVIRLGSGERIYLGEKPDASKVLRTSNYRLFYEGASAKISKKYRPDIIGIPVFE